MENICLTSQPNPYPASKREKAASNLKQRVVEKFAMSREFKNVYQQQECRMKTATELLVLGT
jgi:hypothetical protein